MPLDSENASVFMFHCFRHPVRGPLGNGESGSNPAAALMVRAVYLAERRAKGGEKGTGFRLGLVCLILAGPAVERGGGEVLDQVAAQVHIDDLHAAADAEDRLSGLQERMEQGKLRFVQSFVRGCGTPVLLTETGRMDVTASGQQKLVIRGQVFRVKRGFTANPAAGQGMFIVRCISGYTGDQNRHIITCEIPERQAPA